VTRLSVNINKLATLRNARGGNLPDILKAAKDIERFGAQGITVHPRPDERHIRYKDVYDLKPIVTTEFNIEGYPSNQFIDLVLKVKPQQATLVPDAPGLITSNAGWNTIKYEATLKDTVQALKAAKIRVSLFIDPDEKMIEGAAKLGAERIELYTGPYAEHYAANKEKAITPYLLAAKKAKELGLGINAGHDLNLDNLKYLKQNLCQLDEVSIGHALICDAIYLGLENTVQLYLGRLQ